MTDILLSNGISEIIATTQGDKFNAAPMGIVNRGFLYINMYTGSHTFLNVRQNGQLVANLVSDPILYVESAFDDLKPTCFVCDNGVPVLKTAYAWIEFVCTFPDQRIQRNTVVRLRPVRSKIIKRPIAPINRGFNAVIEAAIHATRYCVLKEPKYLELIDHYGRIVKKCGGQHELKAFELLKTYLAKRAGEVEG